MVEGGFILKNECISRIINLIQNKKKPLAGCCTRWFMTDHTILPPKASRNRIPVTSMMDPRLIRSKKLVYMRNRVSGGV
jgi:hypothetical protein